MCAYVNDFQKLPLCALIGVCAVNIANMSLVVRKPVFGVSEQVRHKPGCTATEEG